MRRIVQHRDTVTINVELVDTRDSKHLCGEQYDRKFSELAIMQDDLVSQITDHLRLRLTGEERNQLAKRQTKNSEAYLCYLRGRYFWNKRTAAGIKKAIEQFQQAIDRDPHYALGYAGLADSY